MDETLGLIIKPRKYEAKIVYEEDVNLTEYQNALEKRMRDRINHPIKWFFKDLLGLTKEIKRKPPKYKIIREEIL